MSVDHHKAVVSKNAKTKTMTAMTHEERDPLNITETMTMTAMDHTNMDSRNAVADKLKTVADMQVCTPDTAESASQHKDSKHKSIFRRKKEKHEKKKRQKAEKFKWEKEREVIDESEREAMDESEREIEELEYSDSQLGDVSLNAEIQEEINDKIQAMDREFESEIKNPQLKKAALEQQHNEAWDKFTTEEKNAIIAYTADVKESHGGPFYYTMNNLLRKKLYKKGGGEDITLQIDNQTDDAATKSNQEYDYEAIEKSKQNYAAVTNCINGLKKATLPRDMVFRRGTNMKALLNALNLQPPEHEIDLSKPIMKNLDRYNDGSQVTFDRGFLSTAAFPKTGFSDEVEWLIQGHAGDEALYIGGESKFPEEEEVLFQAGTRFRILKICPPGTGGTIYNGTQEGTWKVYIETMGLDPLRG